MASKKAPKKNGKGSYRRDFGPGTCLCGETFKKRTPWQQSCSPACKNNAYIIRRAERLIAEAKS